MPVDVVDDVAEVFVVDADGLIGQIERGVQGAGDIGDVGPEAVLALAGEQGQVLGVVAQPERAPAGVALVLVEKDDRFSEGREEERIVALAGAFEAEAGGAGGHGGPGRGGLEPERGIRRA